MTIVKHEDLKKRQEAIILDMSRYNDPIDFHRMNDLQDPTIAGVMVQASYGIYQDKDCRDIIAGAKEVQMPYGLYQYFYPHVDVKRQADAFAEQVQAIGAGVLWPWLDVEEKDFKGVSAAQYCERIAQMCNYMDKITDMETIIYSSPTMLYLLYIGAPEEYDKWIRPRLKCIAKYRNDGKEAASTKFSYKQLEIKPKTEVILHQTSCKGAGKEFGYTSHEADINRFLWGTEEDLEQYMGYRRTRLAEQPQPQPAPEPQPEEEPAPEEEEQPKDTPPKSLVEKLEVMIDCMKMVIKILQSIEGTVAKTMKAFEQYLEESKKNNG
jgi:hypothetical protein